MTRRSAPPDRCSSLGLPVAAGRDLVVRQRRQHRLLPARRCRRSWPRSPRPGRRPAARRRAAEPRPGSRRLRARARRRRRARRADRHQPARCARSLEPVLEFLRAIPPPVLVPVLILFAGIGDTHEGAGHRRPAASGRSCSTRSRACAAADEVLGDTCRSYGIGGLLRLRHLVLRSASPQIMTGARQALSIAHHPDGDQRDVRGQQRPRLHHRAVPARLPDPGDVERRARCSA